MTDQMVDFRGATSSSEDKNLWRETVHSRARERLQPNVGRIQQHGKAAYFSGFQSEESGSWSVRSSFLDYLVAAGMARRVFYTRKSRFLVVGRATHRSGRQEHFAAEELQRSPSEGFLQRAMRLEKQGAVDAALDLVYDQVDGMLKTGRFDQVNRLLSMVEAESLSLDLLLGLLTVTLPARSKLPDRGRLFSGAETALKKRGQWEEGLLAGLES